MADVLLAFGANIGDAAAAFDAGTELFRSSGLREIRRASLWRSKPVDCPEGSPDFVNSALTGGWDGSPEELLALCQRAEHAAGRPEKHGRNFPRTADWDMIAFGGLEMKTENLTLPHPRAQQRLFVLLPASEIAPAMIFPGTGENIENLCRILLRMTPEEDLPVKFSKKML